MYILAFPFISRQKECAADPVFLLRIFCCSDKMTSLLTPKANFIPLIQIILESKTSAKTSGGEIKNKKIQSF